MSTPVKPSTPELAAIVLRLEDFLTMSLDEGRKLGLKFDPLLIIEVIDNAIIRVKTKKAELPVETTAEAYFLDGLCESLVLEQQGVYEKVKDPDGGEAYKPVADESWIECLLVLRSSIARLAK